jgi:hypothetical protein
VQSLRESALEADEHAAAMKLEHERAGMKAIMAEDYWTVAQRQKVAVVLVEDVEVKVAVEKKTVTESQMMDLDEVNLFALLSDCGAVLAPAD